MNRNENIDRRYRGLQSKRAGEHFENMIEASCIWYRAHGLACIDKTPEPTKQLSKPNYKGQFLACYTKAAQPDYQGTIGGGRSVVFEAKHTDADRITYDRLTGDQIDDLEMHHRLGAVAFVLVSFGLEGYYRIPWEVWRDMKAIYGRKYIRPEEAERYRVPFTLGVIKFLDNLLLNEKEEAHIRLGACDDNCVICGEYAGEGAHVCLKCQVRGEKP